MSKNECLIKADVKDVFEILTDGWMYASWVVGASKIARDITEQKRNQEQIAMTRRRCWSTSRCGG